MSHRVVMRFNVKVLDTGAADYYQYLETLETAIAQAKQLGAGPRAKVHQMDTVDGETALVIELPERLAEARVARPRPVVRTKAQQAIADRREARDAALRDGEQVPGHEPPLAKRGKVLKKRRKPRDE